MYLFNSEIDKYRHLDGMECSIIKDITHDGNRDYEETGTMYLIKFNNGQEVECYPEELT